MLVHAATGGVGLAAIQVLRSQGIEVFVTAGSAKKRALLRSMGVAGVASSRSTEFPEVVVLTNGKPIDFVLNSLTSAGMVGASLAALRIGGGFAEISKRDIWSAPAVAMDHPSVNYQLVAFDFLSPQKLQVMLGRLSQALHAGTIKPIASQQSGLIAVRECMREMSGGGHIGKVIVSTAPAPPGLPEAALIVTGGLGTLGKLVATWSVQQVKPARHCPPRHPTFDGPSFIDLNGVL